MYKKPEFEEALSEMVDHYCFYECEDGDDDMCEQCHVRKMFDYFTDNQKGIGDTMYRNIKIDGDFEVSATMSSDEFFDSFFEMIESREWFFGGILEDIDGNGVEACGR